MAHDIAWYLRAKSPVDPHHAVVYNHKWLLDCIINKVKELQLEANDKEMANALAGLGGAAALPIPGLAAGDGGGGDKTGKKTKKEKREEKKKQNKEKKDQLTGAAAAKGGGKGGRSQSPAAGDGGKKPVSKERLDILQKHSADIKAQNLCMAYNKGSCTRTPCPYKHVYFSLKFLGKQKGGAGSGGSKPNSPRGQTPPKTLSAEELARRKTMPCPFQARGSCTWGDKCHYSHSAPLTGGGGVAALSPDGTGLVAAMACCASLVPGADASNDDVCGCGGRPPALTMDSCQCCLPANAVGDHGFGDNWGEYCIFDDSSISYYPAVPSTTTTTTSTNTFFSTSKSSLKSGPRDARPKTSFADRIMFQWLPVLHMFVGLTALRGKGADRDLRPSDSHNLDATTETYLCIERALQLEQEVYGDCGGRLIVQ